MPLASSNHRKHTTTREPCPPLSAFSNIFFITYNNDETYYITQNYRQDESILPILLVVTLQCSSQLAAATACTEHCITMDEHSLFFVAKPANQFSYRVNFRIKKIFSQAALGALQNPVQVPFLIEKAEIQFLISKDKEKQAGYHATCCRRQQLRVHSSWQWSTYVLHGKFHRKFGCCINIFKQDVVVSRQYAPDLTTPNVIQRCVVQLVLVGAICVV